MEKVNENNNQHGELKTEIKPANAYGLDVQHCFIKLLRDNCIELDRKQMKIADRIIEIFKSEELTYSQAYAVLRDTGLILNNMSKYIHL